jgi:hypothetical protein
VSVQATRSFERDEVRPKQVQCEISFNQYEFFNFGVNKFDSGVNPTNRWYEVDILGIKLQNLGVKLHSNGVKPTLRVIIHILTVCKLLKME